MRQERGFTLYELLVVVIVVGITSLALSPLFGELATAQRAAYQEKHKMNNQLIAAALQNWAANTSAYGRLPSAYTGAGYTATIYNPADASANGIALSQALAQTGINISEINNDGTTVRNVRVYQVIGGMTQQVPLYFTSGPLATITYDYGALYLTACPLATVTCNPSATGFPGSTTPAMTGANWPTWTTNGTDGVPFFVSSMPVQKQMLATSVQRLDKVRDTMLGFLRTSQQTAGGGDTTNWYPNDLGTSASNGALSGKSPAGAQQGCRDGWYNLSSGSVLALSAVGLSSQEFGKTAWGGTIEYCRDYDPMGTKTANAPPHFAAVRINASVSLGLTPDAAVPGNNIVLTF